MGPDSCKINGIIDWEMTCVVPRWMAAVHPVFLQDIDLFTGGEVEPPIPSYENEYDEDIENDEEAAIMKRDRWESKDWRDHFDHTLQILTTKENHSAADDVWQEETKRNFKTFIWELTDNIG